MKPGELRSGTVNTFLSFAYQLQASEVLTGALLGLLLLMSRQRCQRNSIAYTCQVPDVFVTIEVVTSYKFHYTNYAIKGVLINSPTNDSVVYPLILSYKNYCIELLRNC